MQCLPGWWFQQQPGRYPMRRSLYLSLLHKSYARSLVRAGCSVIYQTLICSGLKANWHHRCKNPGIYPFLAKRINFPSLPNTNGTRWLCCRFEDIIAVQLQLANQEQEIFLNFAKMKIEMINLITIFCKLPGCLSVKAFKNFLSDVPAWNHKLRLLWTHFWMQSGQHYPMPVLWNYPHWGNATIH